MQFTEQDFNPGKENAIEITDRDYARAAYDLANGSARSANPIPYRVDNPYADTVMTKALIEGGLLDVKYQGHLRKVVPLCLGMLTNGKEALLCLKVTDGGNGKHDLSLRLYHLSKMEVLGAGAFSGVFRRTVDPYLKKQFAAIYEVSGGAA